MKLTEHVHMQQMHFMGGKMVRTVCVYLVEGNHRSVLIDTGVFPNREGVLEFIKETGKQLEDISQILITHAHTDHIGALKGLKELLRAPAAASEKSARWIEDVTVQLRERPVPNFEQFVEGSATVEQKLSAGEKIKLGGSTLEVFEVPGHEMGQLAFFHVEDGVLFTADAVPVPGEMPVYEDLTAEITTLKKLLAIEGVKILLMSWANPYIGQEKARKALVDGMKYVKRIHALVQEGVGLYGGDEPAVGKYVHSALELPEENMNALFMETIRAHMQEIDLIIE